MVILYAVDEEEDACSTHLCGNATVGVDKSYTDHEGNDTAKG